MLGKSLVILISSFCFIAASAQEPEIVVVGKKEPEPVIVIPVIPQDPTAPPKTAPEVIDSNNQWNANSQFASSNFYYQNRLATKLNEKKLNFSDKSDAANKARQNLLDKLALEVSIKASGVPADIMKLKKSARGAAFDLYRENLIETAFQQILTDPLFATEIVVVATKPPTPPVIGGGSSASTPPKPTQTPVGSPAPVQTVSNRCVNEDPNIINAKREIDQKKPRIILLGENHHSVEQHYQDIINSLVPDKVGVCFAMETSPEIARDILAQPENAGYASLISWVSKSMPVTYIDTALNAADAYATANSTNDDQWVTAFTSPYAANLRDSAMNQELRRMMNNGCNTIVSLNGINHLKDTRAGRNTLTSQTNGLSIVVDLTQNLENCKK